MRTDLFACLCCGDAAPDGSGECVRCREENQRLLDGDTGILARFEADFAAEFGEKPS